MKGSRVRKIMDDMSMTASGFAEKLGYTRQGVVQWRTGRNRVPDDVSLWLVELEVWLAAHPYPVRRVREDAVADVKPAPIDFDDDL